MATQRQGRREAIRSTHDELLGDSHPDPQTINANSHVYVLASINRMSDWRPRDLGRMDVSCRSCNARHWLNEKIASSPQHTPIFESCCKKGDVVLPPLSMPPEVLQSLMSEDTAEARHFRTNIRKYNSALAFTSLKYTPDERTAQLGPGFQCFQIHGVLYHMQGPLQPQVGQQPQYSQLFLYDPQYAASIRHQARPELMQSTLEQLPVMLHEINPFISIYKTALERLQHQENQGEDVRIILNPQLRLVLEAGADRRRYNLPTAEEVAMIVPVGSEWADPSFRDIILATRLTEGAANNFTTINPTHAVYMPLHYVLMFPRGDLGWHWGPELQNLDGNRQKTRLSQRAFYRY